MSPAVPNLNAVPPLAAPRRAGRATHPDDEVPDPSATGDRCDWSPAAVGQPTRATVLNVRAGSRELTVLRLASTFRHVHARLETRR